MQQIKPFLLYSILSILLCTASCKKDETPVTPEIPLQFDPIFSCITPADEGTGIDVRTTPTISFHSWEYHYLQKYKLVFDELVMEQNGVAVNYSEVWHTDASVDLVPDERFKPNAVIHIYAKAHWDYLEGETWITPDPGHSEEIETTFTTPSVSSTTIEVSNIEYTYPLPNQYHFLKDEYAQGFIQLVAAQDELFSSPNTTFTVRFSDADGQVYSMPINYQGIMVTFNLPSQLENETIYQLEIVKETSTETLVMYSSHFRTSMYNTAAAKFVGYNNLQSSLRDYVDIGIHTLYGYYSPPQEAFDEYELEPLSGLLRFELDESTPYYQHYLHPLLYEYLGETSFSALAEERINEIKDFMRISEDTDISKFIGYPPTNLFRQSQYVPGYDSTILLTPEQISANNAPRRIPYDGAFHVGCFINHIAYYDYRFIEDWINTNYPSGNHPTWAQVVIDNTRQTFSKGVYKYNLKYTLPNGTVTYEKQLQIDHQVGLEIENIRID